MTTTMNSNLLGDFDANDQLEGDDNAIITMADGTQISVPTASLGDMFSGDAYPDDASIGDDVIGLLGDPEIHHVGDMFSGDMKTTKPRFGSFLPSAKANAILATGKKPTPAQKTAVSVIKTIPGAVLATKVLSPLIINKGLINNAPTRSMLQGAAFLETIKRFETQYPGTTRTQILPNATTNPSFVFAAPTVAEGGNVLYAPVIFIQIATQRQFSVSNAEIRFSISGVNEAGSAVDSRQWTILLSDALESCFFAFIPFLEISSTIYPSIVRASATDPLTVNLYGIPSNTNVRVLIPGPDSSQYQFFKEGFGISAPTTSASNLTAQR